MPETRYLEIAAALEAELRELPTGTRLDSEAELATRFGVGRAAARSALQHLQRRNRIRRVKGVGSFVVRRVDYVIDAERPPSWSNTVRRAGGTPSSTILSCTPVVPPAGIAQQLGLGAGVRCHRLTRRSSVDDLAAAWGIEWVPTSVVPELQEALRVQDSLFAVLTDSGGVHPVRRWVRASADTVTGEVARHLDLDETAQGWYIESLSTDAATGTPLCFSQRWIRADVIRVVFEASESRIVRSP